MCGRFGLFAELDALAEQFNFDPSIMQDIYSPRWNIPPAAPVLSVQRSSNDEGQSGKNTARLLRWGMTGAWGANRTKPSRPLFNARAETVHRLPSFRQAFKESRCLIPASGFYEWKKDDAGNRTPMWFHSQDGASIAFAGIRSTERTLDGDIDACAIITCAANDLLAPVYHRMPVIVPSKSYDRWLGAYQDSDALLVLLQPREWEDVSYHPVSSEVNRAANDYPTLVERATREVQFGLMDIAAY